MRFSPSKLPGPRESDQLIWSLMWGALALAWAGAGCGRGRATETPIPVLFPAAFTDTTLEFPQLRYANGWLSLNDRCPVRKVQLNRRLTPLFVNGRPVGFC